MTAEKRFRSHTGTICTVLAYRYDTSGGRSFGEILVCSSYDTPTGIAANIGDGKETPPVGSKSVPHPKVLPCEPGQG